MRVAFMIAGLLLALANLVNGVAIYIWMTRQAWGL